ncbi:5-amino-6-(5-phosphoribosylamino)uracil reductase [Paramicrobacterium humi]|uniref:5-amino-6-(5-phosphoribosylamino)uracil reductase n=1 Tax=Paramicrobacterium humi TaxID=640635 RepID=A0A1H4NTC7_9MICO|nr:pyrimidine reductase family protein [Microbacterium humi]SEB98389.1 5-amino-6-(5-phosphoribosylamino)uracil reductase [Microbacterium humi]
MTELTRVWPLPAATAEDDAGVADWYEVADRSEPWLRMNFVSSLDGAVTVGGLSGGLGTDADKRVFDTLRTLADVVIVGAGTVRAEGYGPMRVDAAEQRVARGLPAQPVFAIVSARLDLDADDRIFQDAPVRPIVATCETADPERRRRLAEVADVLVCGRDRVEGTALKAALAERGLTQMHSEGGPHLFGAMAEADAVDELCLTLSPMIAGGFAPRIIAGVDELRHSMRLGHVIEGDGTLLLRYVRA